MSRTPGEAAGEFSKKLGQRIRWIRQIQDLTALDVQRRCGIGQKTLVRYERGGMSISANVIERLCETFKVSPTRLCGPLADFAWLVQEQVAQIEAPNAKISKDTKDGSP